MEIEVYLDLALQGISQKKIKRRDVIGLISCGIYRRQLYRDHDNDIWANTIKKKQNYLNKSYYY
jgi:hypothetical protein